MKIEDKNGNLYWINGEKVSLKLAHERRWREIGKLISFKGVGLVFKKFDKITQIHRKTNSWSIPYAIWNKVEGVWIYTDSDNYTVQKKDVDDKKQFLHFLSSGTELKVYIPLEFWKKTKR